MDGKLCNEYNGLVLQKMHEELCSVLNKSRSLMTLHPSHAELELLVNYTAEIRHLLADLEQMRFWSHDDAVGCSLTGITLQFLDLEGRLKEYRNDRLRAIERPGREKA